jgi:hypothetical protein
MDVHDLGSLTRERPCAANPLRTGAIHPSPSPAAGGRKRTVRMCSSAAEVSTTHTRTAGGYLRKCPNREPVDRLTTSHAGRMRFERERIGRPAAGVWGRTVSNCGNRCEAAPRLPQTCGWPGALD